MKSMYYIAGLLALLLVACTDDQPVSELAERQGNIVLKFGTNILNTRTSLNSNSNLQHVEEVHLYIYNESGFYREMEIEWPSPEEISYQSYQKEYPISLPFGTYSFVAVGVDNGSKETYDIEHGTNPDEAIAKLKSGKGKNDIARSELFAGSRLNIHVTDDTQQPVNIEMKRRVSGLFLYVNNLPEETTKIQIEIDQPQFTCMPLVAETDSNQDSGRTPFQDTTGEDSKILLSVENVQEILKENTYTDADGKTDTKLPGSIKKGVYFLPITTDVTMKLILYKNGTRLTAYDVLLKTDEGTNKNFPLLVNQIYCVGNSSAEDEDGNGDLTTIYIHPNWEGETNVSLK